MAHLPDSVRWHNCMKRENEPIPKQRHLLCSCSGPVLTLRLCSCQIRIFPFQVVRISTCKQLLLLRLALALLPESDKFSQWCCRQSVYLIIDLVCVVDKGCDGYQAVCVILPAGAHTERIWGGQNRDSHAHSHKGGGLTAREENIRPFPLSALIQSETH